MVDLREEIKKGKPIFGYEATMRKLKKGELSKIYLSANCKDRSGILKLAKQFGVEAIQLNDTNSQLGVVCKKPYAISVLSF